MRLIRIRYRSGLDFLSHYAGTLPEGGLFYPTRAKLEPGAPVAVEVRFPGLPNRMVLRGTVAWRRPGRYSTGLRAGVGIAFLPEEALHRDTLLKAAQGQVEGLVHRRFRRYPINAPATWRIASELTVSPATLVDIGPGGAYVSDGKSVPTLGADIIVSITPQGAQRPIDIEGRVVWVRSEEPCSFGVAFKARDVGGLRRIKEVVRRLQSATFAA